MLKIEHYVKRLNQMDLTLENKERSSGTSGFSNMTSSDAENGINTDVKTSKPVIHSPSTNGTLESSNKRIKLGELGTASSTAEIFHEQTSKTDDESSVGLIEVNQSTIPMKEETHVNKTSKTATPVPFVSKEEILSQSGREIESIIDGSDLRQFLNKTLCAYLVEGLDQIVALWENGEFEAERQNDIELKRKVVEKFGDIIKHLANK